MENLDPTPLAADPNCESVFLKEIEKRAKQTGKIARDFKELHELVQQFPYLLRFYELMRFLENNATLGISKY